MNQGEPLYQLQTLDAQVEQGQHRITEIQASLGETQALVQARQAATDADAEERKWSTQARSLELEIESLSNKINANERRLYSGSITNPKELGDLQEEAASLKRRRKTLEDELLEAMVYGEEAEETLELCQNTLSETENGWRADQATLKSELDELERHLKRIQVERDQLRQRIAPENITTYDKLRARFGSVVVATLRDGVCSFCAVTPSSTKLKAIRSGKELLKCGNCGRILVAV